VKPGCGSHDGTDGSGHEPPHVIAETVAREKESPKRAGR
jgi:hypothetical protein